MPRLRVERVHAFYHDRQLSVRETAERLGMNMWAVYSFMRRAGMMKRSPSESNRLRFERQPPSFRLNNQLTKTERELRTVGLMLYWGEGAKTGHGVDFANADPAMIVVFVRFLREICGVDESRLRAYLYCYSNQDVAELIAFWSRMTRIPRLQFTRPYVRSDYRAYGRKMRWGLLHVRYADLKLLRW